MPGKAMPLRLGPFVGGLSTYSDASTIADTDCAYLNNMDVDLNGSLVGRPPITKTAINATLGCYDQRILGKYDSPAGVSYIMIAATDLATTTNYLIAYNISLNTYAIITSGTTVKFTAMVKYLTKAWFICDPSAAYTGNGGSWDGTIWTTIAGMAKGATACIYKERVFVGSGKTNAANPSRINFSAASDPATWNIGTDFFDVNNGDGQPITKIYNHNSSIAIFKTNSTFTFAYDSQPTKGQVQSVSSTVGIDGIDCLTESENIVYILHDSRLYGITNWAWEHLNLKVPFEYVNNHTGFTNRTFSVSVLGNKVVCRYYDTLYTFGVKTRVWSKWTPNTDLVPDFWVRSPIKNIATGIDTYYAGNYLTNTSVASANYLFKFNDSHTSTDSEVMTCEFKSKIYDMISYGQRARVYNVRVPYTYKRLMWWGIECVANSVLNASVLPVAYGRPVKWSDISSRGLTWAQRATYTWGNPLDISIQVDDAADIKNLSGIRTFIRYIKSLRFRQIQFVIRSTVDGSTNTGPFQIFSMVAFIANKQTVDKQVN